jgi:hypothetical protein
MLEHPLEAILVFEHVDVFKGNLAAGEILTGSRSVGSKIFAENNYFRCGHDAVLLLPNLSLTSLGVLF